jgi:hypothetical protein
MSIEKQIKENTPPMFLWYTAEDGAVPVRNIYIVSKAYMRSELMQ